MSSLFTKLMAVFFKLGVVGEELQMPTQMLLGVVLRRLEYAPPKLWDERQLP